MHQIHFSVFQNIIYVLELKHSSKKKTYVLSFIGLLICRTPIETNQYF